MSVHAARVTLLVAARKSVAERGGLFFTVGFYAVVIAVLGSLWRTGAAANGGSIAGYTAVAFTWYVATSEAATVSLNARLVEDVGNAIADGSVGVELLRPVPLLVVRVATEVGRGLPRLLGCALAGMAVAWTTAGPPLSWPALALAVPSLLLAISCNVVAMHAFAGAGFWLRDTRSTWFLYQKFVFLLGGMLIPLEVLPAAMSAVAWVLPFVAMAYAPARLASGHVEPVLLLMQAAWLAVLWGLAVLVYGAGERRLAVTGG